ARRIIAPSHRPVPRHSGGLDDLFAWTGLATRPDILARHTTWNANSAAYDLRGPELIFTHEKDVSAKQSEAKQDARVQDSNAHPRRSSRPCPSAEQGPGPAVGLSAESVTLLSW